MCTKRIAVSCVLAIIATSALAETAAPATTPVTQAPITELAPLPAITPAEECLTETGSRIAAERAECVPAHGRVYGGDDIGGFGATTLSDVLRRDPSIYISPRR